MLTNQFPSHRKQVMPKKQVQVGIYLFIYFIQFNDNKQDHHHSLKKSHRPHTKADHKKEKKKYMYKYNVSYKNFK